VTRTAASRRLRFAALAAALLVGLLAAAACGGGGGGAGGGGGQEDPQAGFDPSQLKPEGIVGRDPNGNEGTLPEEVQLTEEEVARAKEEKFQVGIVMQTMDIDWSTLQVEGITKTLEKYGAEVVGVTDPEFDVEQQVAQIENMIQKGPDAIISIPVDDTATAEAYKSIGEAGIELVLMDNVPKGMQPGEGYATMVSSDNQGDGQVAAQVLSEYIPEGGTVGIINFGVDFFVTDEREAGFRKWMEENRSDIKLKRETFLDPTESGQVAGNFLTANPDIEGVFTTWEVPAMGTVTALREQGKDLPITSINHDTEVGIEIAQGGMIKGAGAQMPYDQGASEANATIKALLGEELPPWIAHPALPVVQKNVLDSYEQVYHEPPPEEMVNACTEPCTK
jgi:ribose transport system substrate-binding protein